MPSQAASALRALTGWLALPKRWCDLCFGLCARLLLGPEQLAGALGSSFGGMSDAGSLTGGRGRDSKGASAARRLAAEIVPQWSGASAANTMEYETALKALVVEGHGPVEGLLAAVYTGHVDESKEGFLRYQLLRLGAGSDEEGPLEAESDDDWGADPVAAFEASRRHKVKAQEPTPIQMRAHRAMVRKFCNFISKIVRHSTVQSNRHALSDMEDATSWGHLARALRAAAHSFSVQASAAHLRHLRAPGAE